VQANNRAARTGSSYASFYNSPVNTTYFFTNGINLNAGVTYSAGLWYITETGFAKWPNLSILVGTSQNPVGMQLIAQTSGTVPPVLYTPLSNTFAIPATGVYYIAVAATSSTGVASYLTWDDLSITAACDYNGPNLMMSAGSNSICAGQSINLIAGGADTYQWSTGQTTSSITETPMASTVISVVGTNLLSGCTKTVSQTISVDAAPSVVVFANPATGCPGTPVTLFAQGALFYIWSHGSNNANTVVTPSTSTVFSVTGLNALGCAGTGTYNLVVNQNPVVSVIATNTSVCAGEPVTLSAIGASSFQWYEGSTIMQGNQITVNPTSSTGYTVVGTNNNGCQGRNLLSLNVEECTSIKELNEAGQGVMIYPNPSTGLMMIESTMITKKIQISDMQGRIVYSADTDGNKHIVDMRHLDNGVYSVKVNGQERSVVHRVIKTGN
jgi:hypothetical protein